MEYVFALPGSLSVAWGTGGTWLVRGEAWFADDPFVKAHPEMFSRTPPIVRSTTGRIAEPALSLPEMDVRTSPLPGVRRGRVGG